jgi:predicted nucleotidyltransferase
MLSEIFTKKTLEIIELLFLQPAYIREIAEKINSSAGFVHAKIQILKRHNLVKETKIKNKKVIQINQNNLILRKIKSLMNITKITSSRNYKKLEKIGKVGIYGSFAEGIDDVKSDIDLWILTNKSSLQFASIIRNLEKEMNKKINLLILNNKKIKKLKKHDYEFYIRLRLTSITKYGGVFD